MSTSTDTHRLAIVVLPKPWRLSKSEPYTVEWAPEEFHKVVTLHELDRIVLQLPGPNDGRQECLKAALGRASTEYEPGKGMGVLVSPDIAKSDDTRSVDSSGSSMKQIVALLSLVRHTGLSSDDTQGGRLVEADILAPLVHQMFVSEIQKNLHAFRRGYVRKQAHLPVVRGRVNPLSIELSQQTGMPSLDCTFDDFVRGTPLLRVLVTALEVCSAGTWLSRAFPDSDLGTALQQRSTGLRRRLGSVPCLPIPGALVLAQRIRLNRLTRRFERALDIARQVLANARSEFHRTDTKESEDWIWTVNTSEMWERILVQALRTQPGLEGNSDHRNRPVVYYDKETKSLLQWAPKEVPGPWKGLGGSKFPDILLRHDTVRWILDAKYKIRGQNPPIRNDNDGADEYQMFAYAHLVEKSESGRPAHFPRLALIYPESQIPCIGGRTGPFAIQGHSQTKNPKQQLYRWVVPFPNAAVDVESHTNWRAFLDKLGATLVKKLNTGQLKR